MAGTTANVDLRYPSPGDPDDVPTDMQHLAEDVDTLVSRQGLLSALPSPGNKGARYWATDTGVEYRDDGTAWKPVASAASVGFAEMFLRAGG